MSFAARLRLGQHRALPRPRLLSDFALELIGACGLVSFFVWLIWGLPAVLMALRAVFQ